MNTKPEQTIANTRGNLSLVALHTVGHIPMDFAAPHAFLCCLSDQPNLTDIAGRSFPVPTLPISNCLCRARSPVRA